LINKKPVPQDVDTTPAAAIRRQRRATHRQANDAPLGVVSPLQKKKERGSILLIWHFPAVVICVE